MCLVLAAILLIGAVRWRSLVVWARSVQGRRAIAARDSERAVTLFESAVALSPDDGELRFWLARAYRHTGDLRSVRENIESAAQRGFSLETLEREQWLALAQSGQMREADPYLSRLLLDPREDGREICEAYVAGYLLTHRINEALRLLDVWEAEFPEDPQPHYFRGKFEFASDDATAAAAAYRQALRRDPARRDARVELAKCLVQLHEFDEASDLLADVLEDEPDNLDAVAVWGECLIGQQDDEEAARVMGRLLELDPGNPAAALAMARIRLNNGQVEDALRLTGELTASRPYDVEARYVHALALQRMGDADGAAEGFQFVADGREALLEAASLLRRVAAGDPNQVSNRYRIGRILLEYESPAAGADWLRSVLDYAPHHPPTHAALSEYYERTGNTELAERHRGHLTEPTE